ncbi:MULTISPECIES: hypothetical protein [unclassified Azospirillum]|uniref:hypothetical protein n=1 Tax=unclassified Azospirillum TaxID=2630922 RepID=UPI000D649D5A|nr:MULTISPECIES: hypothetical protein [unclassified Azospirillum]
MTTKSPRRKMSENDDGMVITAGAVRFARKRWPFKVAANLAAVLRISERQAERLVEEKRPWSLRHIGRMTAVFGMEFVATVFHPLAAREAHAEHIAVREYLARQRAANEEKRIVEREVAASSGEAGKRPSLAVRTAGATGRLIAKLARRRHPEAAA